MRVLSGIQPTGRLHLGNYFGAMVQHIQMQAEHDCYYFIADFHALTTVQDPDELRDNVLNVALDYLALGLDTEKTVFFRQSDVPQASELTWILSCVTGKGLLDRAHSYKDKLAKGITPSMGLYNYPLLMASDILLYQSQLVPVGGDQVQHIEMTQDMAGYFNGRYREGFVRPEPRLNQAVKVPGVDGEKMSKSYGNTIEMFAPEKQVRKKIMSIKTDSTPVEDPKDPDQCTVFALLRLLASDQEQQDWAQRYRAGGMGYGEVKKRLAELVIEHFSDARKRREALVADPAQIEQALAKGGQRAYETAEATMQRVREACGIR